ncbi:uncharacterized protein PHALS_09501 [Plasmopara halstedii]|uniref:Uncharacterized protein n=1 Tax=Plasmopara halstedii TaxID=4781 RepID=A0A0P1A5I8_PLAHL|nr:uncharacterized protein PHALS_09501 [Plasmopara halstedii]CEG35378.1 hypothetical protein PHALS_09501 [Plasmopara halstedii]|eukprot:XP_024571747.1 hypothetical protein PHALS_09501 [Plasmopara halstedii]
MMTLPTDDVPPPPTSRGDSTAIVPVSSNKRVSTLANPSQSDLELHLLQTFAAYASQQLVHSYLTVKHVSRVTRFLANMTENLASRAGLVAIVRILFSQYMKIGHPYVQRVDDAMGKRVIDAVVRVLMLARQQPASHVQQTGILALEAGAGNTDNPDVSDEIVNATKLSYAERFQALLLGEVPRMEQVLIDARRQAEVDARAKVQEQTRLALPPVVMELKDFMPVGEVTRLKEENQEHLLEPSAEALHLHKQMEKLIREKQQLEQKLTDVHNYQKSERGQRFQDMEKELARKKLENTQMATDLRKNELLLNALTRKLKKKSRSQRGDNQSSMSMSAPPSPFPEKTSKNMHELKHNSSHA